MTREKMTVPKTCTTRKSKRSAQVSNLHLQEGDNRFCVRTLLMEFFFFCTRPHGQQILIVATMPTRMLTEQQHCRKNATTTIKTQSQNSNNKKGKKKGSADSGCRNELPPANALFWPKVSVPFRQHHIINRQASHSSRTIYHLDRPNGGALRAHRAVHPVEVV